MQTYAYELGIEKAVSEMTQAEKMQLRLIAILDQSRVSWGDQANTINSLANQMRILENNMSEISLVLGQLFVPLMENALPVVNGLTRAIKNLLVNLAGILGIKIDPNKFGQGFTEIEDNFEGITEGTEEAEKALEEYKNQLLGFDEVNKLQDVDATATLDTEQGAGFDITQEILDATEEYEKFWQEAFAGMEDYSAKWEKHFSKIIEPLKNFFEVIGKKGSNGIGEALGGFVSETAQKFNKFLSSSIDKIDWGELARKFVTEFVDFVVALSPVELAGSFNALGNSLTSAIVKALINGVSQTILETPRFIAGLVGIDVDFGIDETALQSGVSASALALSKEIKDLVENYQDLRDARIVSFENSIVEYSYLENLKNRYFDLAEETNRDITKEQELQALRELIIKEYPDFAEILNDTKLSYEEQEKAIDDIISALKKKAKVEAAQEILVEIEKERLKLQKQIDKYDKEALETGQEKYKEAQELRAEYDKNKETIDELGRAMEQAFQDMDMQLYYDLEEQQAELIEQNEKLVPQIAGLIDEYSLLTSGYNQLVREMDGLNAEFDYYLGQASGVINSTDNIRDSINKLSQTASTAGNNFGTIFAEQLAKSVKSKMALADFVSVGEQIAKDLGKGLMKANGYDYRLDIEVDSVEGFINFKNKWGIGAYATGGFPEDGLFFANHNELVGKFSNGKTAVANNAQIVEGIKSGVYDAVTSAIMSTGGNGSNVTVVLQGDADNLFRVVQSKADNYTMQTGRPAFII